MMLGVGLIQLVLILATIYVANEHNRNWLAWGLAAVFFPVITLVVVALLPALRRLPPPTGDVRPPTLAVCSACGRISPDPSARFCSNCGSALPQAS